MSFGTTAYPNLNWGHPDNWRRLTVLPFVTCQGPRGLSRSVTWDCVFLALSSEVHCWVLWLPKTTYGWPDQSEGVPWSYSQDQTLNYSTVIRITSTAVDWATSCLRHCHFGLSPWLSNGYTEKLIGRRYFSRRFSHLTDSFIAIMTQLVADGKLTAVQWQTINYAHWFDPNYGLCHSQQTSAIQPAWVSDDPPMA